MSNVTEETKKVNTLVEKSETARKLCGPAAIRELPLIDRARAGAEIAKELGREHAAEKCSRIALAERVLDSMLTGYCHQVYCNRGLPRSYDNAWASTFSRLREHLHGRIKIVSIITDPTEIDPRVIDVNWIYATIMACNTLAKYLANYRLITERRERELTIDDIICYACLEGERAKDSLVGYVTTGTAVYKQSIETDRELQEMVAKSILRRIADEETRLRKNIDFIYSHIKKELERIPTSYYIPHLEISA